MRIPDEKALTTQVTNWKARFIAGLMVSLGAVVAGTVPNSWPAWLQAIVLALATTAISIGALSLIIDLALRRNLQEEIARLVVIQRSVIEGQIISVGRAPDISWERLLALRSEYRILLLDPANWVDGQFHHILESGKGRVITVEFFLPDPDAPYVLSLAESLELRADDLSASIRATIETLERLWMAQAGEGPLRSGSKITVRHLRRRPLYSLILADTETAMIVSGCTGREGADVPYAYIFSGARDTYPSSWFERQLKRHEHANIAYENEVR